MWSPTHLQVTIHKARDLLIKGKNGTNNCYVTISLGKEKYMTTLQKDASKDLEWHEQCELAIPEKGNRAGLVLTCLHQNNLGLDEFLGQVTLPLNEMDVYDNPRSKWYKLLSKPGKEKKKERGELEVRIGFTVKESELKKEKHKSSLGQIASNMSGSLLSINTLEKRKNLKKFAKSLGSKMHITGKKKEKHAVDGEGDSISGSVTNVWATPNMNKERRQMVGDADPGVISEDEDEFCFDNLSHKSSGSSLNVHNKSGIMNHSKLISNNSPIVSLKSNNSSIPDIQHEINLKPVDNEQLSYKDKSATLPIPPKPPRISSNSDISVTPKKDEWEEKLYGKHLEAGSTDSLKRRSWDPTARVPLAVPKEEEEEKPAKTVTKSDSLVQSNTAPSSPAVSEKVSSKPPKANIPQALPRSNTLESITEKVKESDTKEKEKKQTDKENKFTKKLKYLRREFGRSDNHHNDDMQKHPKSGTLSSQFFHHGERIIIGHENDINKMMSNGELPQEVLKKYEGKSKEEVMGVAYQLENEVKYQKQRVKELEDYLDNLLLRVMETHPKILQNPYSKLNSTKSG